MEEQAGRWIALAQQYAVEFGLKIAGAIALWIVGGWVIKFIVAAARTGIMRSQADTTVAGYLATSISVLLKVVLIVAILGVLGVETASFAALLAAGGVAIGVAWSGLLSHFAAGVFLVFLRPFKVGDQILAGGVEGVVTEIGMFATTILKADNVKVTVGNNKIFSDNIVNYSATPYRAVDLRMQLGFGVDWRNAAARLKPKLAAIPNVIADPTPLVEPIDANAMGTVLVVRPFCANAHYWDVHFAAQKAMAEAAAEGGYPLPMTVQKQV